MTCVSALPPSSYHVWVPVLFSFGDEQQCGSISRWNPFLPNLLRAGALYRNRNPDEDTTCRECRILSLHNLPPFVVSWTVVCHSDWVSRHFIGLYVYFVPVSGCFYYCSFLQSILMSGSPLVSLFLLELFWLSGLFSDFICIFFYFFLFL